MADMTPTILEKIQSEAAETRREIAETRTEMRAGFTRMGEAIQENQRAILYLQRLVLRNEERLTTLEGVVSDMAGQMVFIGKSIQTAREQRGTLAERVSVLAQRFEDEHPRG